MGSEGGVTYFWGEKGANADIERHRVEEVSIRKKIEELEALPMRSLMDERTLNAYRHFLCQLLESKARAVEKIGRKKG